MFVVCAFLRFVQKQDPFLPLLFSVFVVSVLRCIELCSNAHTAVAAIAAVTVLFDYAAYKNATGNPKATPAANFNRLTDALRDVQATLYDCPEDVQEMAVLDAWHTFKTGSTTITNSVKATEPSLCPFLCLEKALGSYCWPCALAPTPKHPQKKKKAPAAASSSTDDTEHVVHECKWELH